MVQKTGSSSNLSFNTRRFLFSDQAVPPRLDDLVLMDPGIGGGTIFLRYTMSDGPSKEANIWLMPNVVYMGGFQCLFPQDLEEFVQSFREHGVVIMTVGTLVAELPEDIADEIAAAFARLPQEVIWRRTFWDTPRPAPFVAHGGTNGVQEAIYHCVLPLAFDPPDNLSKAKGRGAAKMVDIVTGRVPGGCAAPDWACSRRLCCSRLGVFQEAVLLQTGRVPGGCAAPDWACSRRLCCSRLGVFQEAVLLQTGRVPGGCAAPDWACSRRLCCSRLHRDQPIKPLDKAVFWIDFVKRHKGARHLRTESYKMSWIMCHSVDVMATLLMCVLLVTLVCLADVRCVSRKVFCRSKVKSDKVMF
ncbi:unnamed protein product [Coregonus sp. 'balchen']|nr:unnamed protein product [Coregonus sp. 'balchen']